MEKLPDFNSKKKIFKAGVVDITKLREIQAKDMADARMTESKEERAKGFKNWFAKTGKRIWKHNLAQEWYRQREIGRARKEITESGNLYAGENGATGVEQHEKAVNAIIDRFTSEYEEEMLKKEEKDSKQTVTDTKTKEDIKNLMKQFAGNPSMSEDAFKEGKNRIIAASNPEYAEKGKMYADNLLDIAKEIRNSVVHGEKLEEMDFDVEITLGQAKESLNTEAKYNTFDKLVEKTQNSKIGKYLTNEPVAMGIVAGLYSAGNFLGMKALRSKAVKWGTFGASALLAGGVAAAKESARLERERAQHIRESAKGMKFEDEDMRRRKDMEKSRYETKNASEIIKNLEKDLAKVSSGSVTENELNNILANLSDLEARVQIGDKEKADLVAYSKFDQVEKERMTLDLYRAKLKVAIRNGIQEGRIEFTKGDFNTHLQQLTNVQGENLSTDIESKDKLFKKMKRYRVAMVGINTAIMGAGMGFVFQEAHALLGHSTDSVIEGVIKHIRGREDHMMGKATALEGLRRWMTGDGPRIPFGHGHEAVFDGIKTHFQIPDGTEMVKNADGTFNLMHGHDVIGNHLKLETMPNGDLTPHSQELLAKNDIYSHFSQTGAKVTEHITTRPDEYANKHPELFKHIHRGWMDNDTPKFDKNELRLEWGGNNGMDAHGNYVFNVQHMANDGSYHNGLSVAAHDQMKHGGLKVLLSLTRGSQHQVFEVPIDANGNAIIDPHSPAGQMMFENHNGHALFKGAFAEVGHPNGIAPDGGENMQVLATHIGTDHVGSITDTVIKDTTIPYVKFDEPLPWDYDVPPVIPIVPRRPLERGEYEGGEAPVPPPIYYSGGTQEEIQKEFKEHHIEQNPYSLKTLEDGREVWVDKNGKEVKRDLSREKERIGSYLDRQPERYIKQLRDFNNNLEPMDKNCRVSVIIPARFEEKNLKNLLDQYVKQVDDKGKQINKNLFEINIIVNREEGEKADTSMEIIKEWKKANPGYHVNAIDVVFSPENANVGTARKYITDLSLLRSSERKQSSGPLYIESEDADLFGIDKRTINKLINNFDKKPHLDVLRGLQDRQPEIMSKNDLFFFERRLWDIGEMRMRDLSVRSDKFDKSDFVWNRVISGGWNTAYTAEAYAEIGGYVPDRIGEDMKIGQKISVLRGQEDPDTNKFTPNTHTAETSGLRANSSPRRFIDALMKGKGPYDPDIWEDQSLKGKTLDELMDGIKKWEKISPEHKQRYESGINTLYGFMKERMGGSGKEVKKVMEETLFYLGLKNVDYTIENNDKIKITDKGFEKIGSLLSDYKNQEKWKLGYRRQNSPIEGNKKKSKEKSMDKIKETYLKQIEKLKEKLKEARTLGSKEEFSKVVDKIKKIGKKKDIKKEIKDMLEEGRQKLLDDMIKKLREDLKVAERERGGEDKVLRIEEEIRELERAKK